MNKKLTLTRLFAVASIVATTAVSAHPAYIAPANALGSCGDCHVGGTRSKNFVPGLIESFGSLIDQNLPIQDKIKAIFKLTDAQRLPVWKAWDVKINPKPTTPDTAPKIKVGAATYTYTIGGKPLVIPVQVMDAEKDSYQVDQAFGDNFRVSKPTPFKGDMSSFRLTAGGIPAAYAGLTFPIELSVKESQRKNGRVLQSNTVKFNIRILRKK